MLLQSNPKAGLMPGERRADVSTSRSPSYSGPAWESCPDGPSVRLDLCSGTAGRPKWPTKGGSLACRPRGNDSESASRLPNIPDGLWRSSIDVLSGRRGLLMSAQIHQAVIMASPFIADASCWLFPKDCLLPDAYWRTKNEKTFE